MMAAALHAPFPPGAPHALRTGALSFPAALSKPVAPIPVAVVVDVPARLGFSVRDMSTFGPGKPGGGGVGMALALASRTYVCVAPSKEARVTVGGSRTPVLEHHIAVFLACLGPVPPLAIAAVHTDVVAAHSGLGSTSGAAFGVLVGLNAALGAPFTHEQLRRILAWNYVEEDRAQPHLVSFGFETTMTATGALGGGLYDIDPHTLDIVARNVDVLVDAATGQPLPVLVFGPDPSASASVSAPALDEATLLAEGAVHDGKGASDAETKARLFDDVIDPQLRLGAAASLHTLGDAIYQLQNLGGKRVEVLRQPAGRAICAFMDTVRTHAGVHIVGMSSIGPSVAVVCSAGDAAVRAAAEATAAATGMRLLHATAANVDGLRVRSVPVPRCVLVVGHPFAGKTSLCAAAAQAAGGRVAHVAAGAILRSFVHDPSTANTADAAVIRAIMERGAVADEGDVTTRLLVRKIHEQIASQLQPQSQPPVLLLDGFPRSAAQLLVVHAAYGIAITHVVVVAASADVRARRAAARPPRTNEPSGEARDAHDQTDAILAAAAALGIPSTTIDTSRDPLDASVQGLLQLVL